MLRNFLEIQNNGAGEGGTDQGPRPGDYDLGSLESRAAARALLSEKLAGDQQNRLRAVVTKIGGTPKLEASTCLRYQCTDNRDPGRNLVVEMVKLDGDHPTAAQLEHLDRWICRVPLDGKTYKFAKVDVQSLGVPKSPLEGGAASDCFHAAG
jgi:hypothetical protein